MDALLKIPLIILLLVACVQGEKDGEGECDSLTTEGPVCRCKKGIRLVSGGGPAGEDTFPFAAGIVDGEFNPPFCGGTLITDRHVLTAAHCFEDETPINELLVNVGNYYIRDKRDGQYFPIRNIIRHPEYDPVYKLRDIAIVELKQPVSFNEKIQTVSLPKPGFQLKPGSEVIVFGWGQLETDGRHPNKLHAVKLPVIDNRTCDRMYPGYDNIICAGGEEGKDSCVDDSGSGLVKELNNQYVQVGVVSIGDEDCGRPNNPAAYTRVSNFIDWILDNTKSAGCKPCIYDKKQCRPVSVK